jgi:biopolymer transport protein ExbD
MSPDSFSEPEADAVVDGRPPSKIRSDDELDMTPMVDVTFLLLIFFMITAAFALQKVLSVPPVQDDEEVSTQQVDDIEKDSIVVRIDEDNVFWIGGPLWQEEQKAVSTPDMRAKVREAKTGGPGIGPTKMLVRAHGDAVHEKMVDALDAGAAVEMNQISVMVYEDGDL